MTLRSNMLFWLTLLSIISANTAETRTIRKGLSRRRLSPNEITSQKLRSMNEIELLLQNNNEAIFDLYFGRTSIETQPSLSLSSQQLDQYQYEFSMSMSYTYSMSMSHMLGDEMSFSMPMSLSVKDDDSSIIPGSTQPSEKPSSSPSEDSNILLFSNDPSEDLNTTDLSRADFNISGDTANETTPSSVSPDKTPIVQFAMGGLFIFILAAAIFVKKTSRDGSNSREYQDIGSEAHSEFSLRNGPLVNIPLEP